MKQLFPPSFYNLVTLIGSAIASVSFGLILFLFVLEFFTEQPKPYIGIITFIILPIILLAGIVLIAAGILREHRRERSGNMVGRRLPEINLNNPKHRSAFVFFSFGTVLLLAFSAFGSFKAYEYTDSDRFCGETCHTVMEPEYTAYQYSPHARVGCVQCHIGSGADWFVRSKISGSYQVYATLFDKFPRPIPTPIENLRPAQQTCEQCHWPEHFFSEKKEEITYFISDEINTKWNLTLLMKIGGGNMETGPASGIHWYMNIANEVTYAALDTQRQVIPWIESKRPDGSITTYRSLDVTVPEESLKKAFRRRMDCIDCHNRPSHLYYPPARSVNHAMSLGWIDIELPNIKSVAVGALEREYRTKTEALDSIKSAVTGYYRSGYAGIFSGRRETIDSAIIRVQNIYKRNYFPEMKVSWKKFPDNIGHLYYDGCFRCHDGRHIADDGKILSNDCNMCHTILAQKSGKDSVEFSLDGTEYRHPADIGDAWKETKCSECHYPQ